MLKSFRLAVFIIAVFTMANSHASEGSLASANIEVQGTPIQIIFAPDTGGNGLSVSREQLVQWIEKAANAVANYYQGFPVSKLTITITKP